jgi:hypothetical protein
MKRNKHHPNVVSVAALVAVLLLAIGGCGGGGGSESVPATVAITLTNVLGEPAAGVDVTLYPEANRRGTYFPVARTDASGRATFAAVPSGSWRALADESGINFSSGYWGAERLVTVPNGGHVEAAMTLRPDAYPFAALGPSSVREGGISSDGRSLEFSLRLFTIPDFVLTAVRDCVPKPDNDVPAYQADCLKGPPDNDVAYEVAESSDPLVETRVPGGSRRPYSVAVLMDQSSEMSLNDPSDLRLFALKYFLTTLQQDDRVLIGAFSADDSDSGHLSALPDTPLTTLPAGTAPVFAAADRALFPAIDLLGAQEGGAAPLYASIDRMLELTAATAPDRRRSVVVLTDGLDRTCGTPAECEAALQALIAKSRAAGVAIFTISLRSNSEIAPGAISELTQASGGASLWLSDFQLGRAFGALGSLLDGSAEATEWRFRILAATEGAFRSGRTVLGTASATFTSCDGLSCGDQNDLVPFAVRIP